MSKPEPSEAATKFVVRCRLGLPLGLRLADDLLAREYDAALREAQGPIEFVRGCLHGAIASRTLAEKDQAKAEAEAKRLRGCLRAYGEHGDDCQAVGQHDPYHDDCDCGLCAALEEVT